MILNLKILKLVFQLTFVGIYVQIKKNILLKNVFKLMYLRSYRFENEDRFCHIKVSISMVLFRT